jgi:hypothetical protein
MGEFDGMFLELGDDDPLMRGAEMDGAPPRPAKGYTVVSRAWLAQVRPVLRTADRLLVGMELYRLCLMRRCRVVKLTNKELKAFGISRQTKQRALLDLEAVGALTVGTENGQAAEVTLHWFP